MPTRPDANGTDPNDDSVSALVHRAVDDARELGRAEVALVKAKVGERANAYKGAAIYFAIAGTLAMAALIALLVGLIMSVATLIGPGFATLLVIGLTLVVALILAWLGKSRLAPPKELA